MADYYSLLARLIDGLPDAAPTARQNVYDRARRTLADQLRAVTPPLTEAEIAREGSSLESAIRQLEARYADGARSPVPPEERDQPKQAEVAPPAPSGPGEAAGENRPVAIRRGGRRTRPLAMLAVLVCLAIPVATLAWLWRDQPRPEPAQETAPPVAAAPAQNDNNKFSERVGGLPAEPQPNRPARPPAAPQPAQSAAAPQPRPASPPALPSNAGDTAPSDVAVAQRALIFEENPSDPQQPIITTGRALWRLDNVNAGQGLPLETVIRGTVELPSAGLTLTIAVRRNLDPALPASHTIELTFANASVNGAPPRVVRDVALPMMRPEETIRGIPVAGLPVPVKENVFLIGLSDLRGDVDRNTELLLRRNWMELPIRFASGQKAALLFDKGVSGERVFLDAFRKWGQLPQQ